MTEDEWARLEQLICRELDRRGLRVKPDPTGAERTRRWREKKATVTVTSPVTRHLPEEKTVTVTVSERHKKVNGHAGSRANAEQNALAWSSYASAYKQRYGVDPVRNAKVNGQLAQLVKRLGDDAAPIAAWFLGHGAARYVAAGHTVGLLLVDAEKLHTEWSTGRRITATQAVQSDKTQANGDMWGKLIEEARHG